LSLMVLVVVAFITYVSRVATLVFLSRPGGRVEVVLGRMPAPIFASLAILTLVTGDRSLANPPILCAALGAALMSPARSLPLCLIGGIGGYTLATLLF
jgi:branched-subunit amino acid transport protein